MRIIHSLLAILICLMASSAVASAQEWPTYRHDDQRTGVQPTASNLSNPNTVASLKVVRSFPGAPAAIAGPFINTFAGHDQQHFAWLAAGGEIWDAFFSASDNKWHLQEINCGKDSTCQTKNSSATTDGPQAVADSFVDTFAGHDQQHFAYRDQSGIIWDSFFSASDNKWHCQQINGPNQNNSHCLQVSLGGNNGPSAVQGPFINTFAGHDQQHLAWLAAGGEIWDAFFSASDNKWHLQEINLNGVSAPSVGPFQASPIVVNDTVYIGNEDGYFYALDAATLDLKWQFPSAGQNGLKGSGNFAYGIGAAASFWTDVRPHGAVVFAAQDPSLGEGGRLFALDAATGKPITNWPSTPISSLNNSDCDKSHLRQRIEHSSPLIFNGKAYVGIQSFEDPVQIGQVAAVDLATGQRDQTFNGGPPSAQWGARRRCLECSSHRWNRGLFHDRKCEAG